MTLDQLREEISKLSADEKWLLLEHLRNSIDDGNKSPGSSSMEVREPGQEYLVTFPAYQGEHDAAQKSFAMQHDEIRSGKAMTTIHITLPDHLAQQAQSAGLLTPERLEQWLREQLKTQRVDELFLAMERMAEADDPAVMSPEEMAQEIAAMRAERRKLHGD